VNDYTYPSVYFAYLFFALMTLLALFFLIRSLKNGYWGKQGEEPKHRMMDED